LPLVLRTQTGHRRQMQPETLLPASDSTRRLLFPAPRGNEAGMAQSAT
jgi:hypothetical protein